MLTTSLRQFAAGCCGLLFSLTPLFSQEYVLQTFRDTRIVNGQSVETIGKRKLDARISHRFGDIAGDNGGFATFYGLENVTDVSIGVDYGLSDNLNIGFYRAKGAGRLPNGAPGLRQLLNGTLKYRFIRQQEGNQNPVTVTAYGLVTMSAAEKVEGNEDVIQSFPEFAHRFAYHGQLMIARKFSDGFSLQLSPGYTYRNLVVFDDVNGLFSLSVGSRIQLSKVHAILLDGNFPISQTRNRDEGFYPAFGIGWEIDTGGHRFQLSFTNATALMETDFIPYTASNWWDGELRIGFTISRLFNL